MDEPNDIQALNLAKTIRQNETGGSADPYNQKGASGEFGAYQFMPSTYKEYAQKYLGDSNAQPNVENQNKIAYSFVKEKKDAGYNPAQILSMWNAGEKNPDAYKGTFYDGSPSKGTNKEGVQYDVPGYVAKGSQIYHKLSGQNNQTQIQPTASGAETTSTQGPVADTVTSLGDKLSGRFKAGAQAVSDAATGKDTAPVLSAPLQVAGEAAGALGDVVNAGAELIPGVKQAEGLIGKGAAFLANTGLGKDVLNGITKFSQQHPELSKDIGAAANIASVIPMFKAIGSVSTIAKGGIDKALQNQLANAAKDELSVAVNGTKAGRKLVMNTGSRGINPIQDAVDNRILPDVVPKEGGGFRWDTAKADDLANQAESIQEDNLRSLLNQADTRVGNPGEKGFITSAPKTVGSAEVPLSQARDTALKEVQNSLKFDPGLPAVEERINGIFNDWESRYGSNQSLNTITDMKRQVRTGVKFDMPSQEKDARFYTGQALMKLVEDTASSRGIKEVRDVNQTMARIINVRKMLAHLEGKPLPVKKASGLLREIGADAAGFAAEGIGHMTGVPFAATLAGRTLGRSVLNRTPGVAIRGLQRAEEPLLPTAIKGIKKGVASGLLRASGTQLQGPQR